MSRNFEYYLEGIFMKEEPWWNKDQIEDAFDRWLSSKDVDDIIDYGNKALEEMREKWGDYHADDSDSELI